MEDHPLSDVRDCFFNISAANLNIWRSRPPPPSFSSILTLHAVTLRNMTLQPMTQSIKPIMHNKLRTESARNNRTNSRKNYHLASQGIRLPLWNSSDSLKFVLMCHSAMQSDVSFSPAVWCVIQPCSLMCHSAMQSDVSFSHAVWCVIQPCSLMCHSALKPDVSFRPAVWCVISPCSLMCHSAMQSDVSFRPAVWCVIPPYSYLNRFILRLLRFSQRYSRWFRSFWKRRCVNE
jgi:hypothetical protein